MDADVQQRLEHLERDLAQALQVLRFPGNAQWLRLSYARVGVEPFTIAVPLGDSVTILLETLEDQQHAFYLPPSLMVLSVNNLECYAGFAHNDALAGGAEVTGIEAVMFKRTKTGANRTEVYLYISNNTATTRTVSYGVYRVVGLH